MLRLLCLFIFCLSFHVVKADETPSIPLEICSPTECYKVIKELGEGAFGIVYAVEDSNGQSFAIKSYKISDFSHALPVLADAEREFDRGQFLNHPNIVKSLEIFNTSLPNQEMTWYLVLELIHGQTIYNTQKGSLTRRQGLKATLQLVNALRYALSLGLMHLDLHAGNVMLDLNGNLKIIDLASFFTVKEMLGYVENESSPTLENEALDPPAKVSLKSQNKSMNHLGQNVNHTIQFVPPNDNKLKKFFRENPEVFNNIKQLLEKNKKTDATKLNIVRFAPNLEGFGKHPSPSSSEISSSDNVHIDHLMESMYFQRITEICISMISKSNWNREKKFDLCAEIKKLEWLYEDIVESGEAAYLDDYLQELIQLLK